MREERVRQPEGIAALADLDRLEDAGVRELLDDHAHLQLVGLLVVVGLGLFVVITANFLNLMLRNETLKAPQSDVMRAELDALTRNQQAILDRIEEIQKAMNRKK